MIVLLSLACLKDFNGTVVGNPGSASTAQVAPSADVEYTNANISIESISYHNDKDCPSDYSPSGDYCPSDETDTIVEDLNISIDLLDPSNSFSLLGGSWTSITIQFAEKPLGIQGIDSVGEEFQLNLSLEQLTFTSDEPYELQQSYILELASPDWLVEQNVDDTSSLEEHIRTSSGFYLDVNDDGFLQEEERIPIDLTIQAD